MPVRQRDAQHDAEALNAVHYGDGTYYGLCRTSPVADLDASLDRLIAAGFVVYRLKGKTVRITEAGRKAREHVFARGFAPGGLLRNIGTFYPREFSGAVGGM